MANDIVQTLIDRFEAKQWLEPEPRDVNVLAWNYSPSALDRKWTPLRMRVRDLAPRRGNELDAIAPSAARMTDSMWEAGGEEGSMLHVTTFETSSRAEARAWLLRTLAEFETPRMERAKAGEIGFISEGHAAGAFARGNVVFFVRNAGRELERIQPVLETLDAQLADEPKRFKTALDIPVPRAKAGKPATIELPDPAAGGWYRIYVRGGEARVQKGRVVVEGSGTVDITVARDSPQGSDGTKLQLTFE